MKSIRSQINLTILIGLFIVNCLTGYFSYLHSKEELEELFDAEQAQLARIIESLVSKHLSLDSDTRYLTDVPILDEVDKQVVQGHRYEKKLAFQVWDNEGNLRIMSKNAPIYPLSAHTSGFSQITYQNTTWHIFTLYVPSEDIWVHTAQRDDVRQELINLLVWSQLWPLALISLLIAVLVIVLVSVGLAPLQKFSRQLDKFNLNQMNHFPDPKIKELQPVHNSLNLLIEQVRLSIAREKSFSADAAHELRTPLAALRVHAQNIELTSQLDKHASQSLKKMLLSVDRMAYMLEQLLQLNKLENQMSYPLDEQCELRQIAIEVISELPPSIARDYQIALIGENCSVRGNARLISILLRNLIENAYKYSPKYSDITVSLKQDGHKVYLSVSDQGVGMTAEQKQHARERFYRVPGHIEYGAGLGLSIVSRIVQLHRAKMKLLDNPEHIGLTCQITFNAIATNSIVHLAAHAN